MYKSTVLQAKEIYEGKGILFLDSLVFLSINKAGIDNVTVFSSL